MVKDFSKIESSYFLSGIPTIHKDSHLKNFENKYAKSNAIFWNTLIKLATTLLEDPKSFPKFVFLCGHPGNGKTHFLVGLYRALIHVLGYSGGDGASFFTFASLNAEIIAGFADNVPIRTAMSNYTQSKWLFIDDFTASERILKANSMEQTILRDIILDRFDKGYHMITTCNFSSLDLIHQMDGLFGNYVVSRINSSNKIVQFPQGDFRTSK